MLDGGVENQYRFRDTLLVNCIELLSNNLYLYTCNTTAVEDICVLVKKHSEMTIWHKKKLTPFLGSLLLASSLPPFAGFRNGELAFLCIIKLASFMASSARDPFCNV